MRQSVKIIVIIFVFIIIPNRFFAQWTQVSGPSGAAKSLAIENSTIISVINGEVFSSEDFGQSWKLKNSALMNATCLAYMDGNIYAGDCSEKGIRILNDDGIAWKEINSGLTNICTISIEIVNGNIFLGTLDGIFKSTNSGDTWIESNEGLPTNNIIKKIYFHNSQLFVSVDGFGVYVSSNEGTSWEELNSGLPLYPHVEDFAVENSALLIICNSAVYRLNQENKIWYDLNFGTFAVGKSEILISDDRLFLGGRSGITLFNKNGSEWQGFSNRLTFSSINEIKKYGDQILAASNNGMYISSDNGDTWKSIDKRLRKDAIVSDILKLENFLVISTWDGVYFSYDEGKTWVERNNGLSNNYVFSISVNESNIYAGTLRGAFRSDNDGLLWEDITFNLPETSIIALPTFNSKTYAVTSLYGIFQFDESNNVWGEINNEFPRNEFGSYSSYIDYTIVDSTIYILTGDGLMKLNNESNSWQKIELPQTLDNYFTSIESINSKIVISTFSGGLYLTSDFGENWQKIDSEFTSNLISCLTTNGEKIFAAINSDGVYEFSIETLSWGQCSVGLPINNDINFSFINIIDGYIYTSFNEKGLWSVKLSDLIVSINHFDIETPEIYSLEQSYPNPFNPITTIQFSIPEQSHVSLTIYDILGKDITTLVNEIKNKGKFEVTFNASNLSSGVYFCKMQAGNFVESKKLMLLK